MYAGHAQLLSHVWLSVAHQTPLSMEFSSQKYWSRLPFPILGDFPDPGIEPVIFWTLSKIKTFQNSDGQDTFP